MSDEAERFVAGVDEAGYGPLLGPLTVGVVRIDGPPEALREALRARDRRPPVIADSKRLFAGADGLAALERAALIAATLARGATPRTLGEFIGETPAGFSAHPWYGDLERPLPLAANLAEIEAGSAALGGALARAGGRLALAHVDVHLEQEYNARCRRLGNKGAAHWEHVSSAFLRALTGTAVGGRVDCDRLGGRKDYGSLLCRLFPFRPWETIVETSAESAYAVRTEQGRVAFSFRVGGETHSPAVAWASCAAKYAREALMRGFQEHFAARAPEVAPTAGYWEDGRRFLAELVAATGDDTWPARLSRER